MSWMACDTGIMLAVRMLGCTPMSEIVGRGRVVGLDSAYRTTEATRGQTQAVPQEQASRSLLPGSRIADRTASTAGHLSGGLQQRLRGVSRRILTLPRCPAPCPGGHLLSIPSRERPPSCTNHPNKPACLACWPHSQYSALRRFPVECQGVPTGCEVPTTRIG